MKKVKLIYNPYAGDRSFPRHIDSFIEKFQKAGYKVDIFRSMEPGDFGRGLNDIDESFNFLAVAGGDGSANQILNVMKKKKIDLPLAIIPAGTVNDFASYLGMTQSIEKSFDKILEHNIKEIDIGCVNDRYFLNVCVGGVISNISQGTDTELKNRLGKVAYYLHGVTELPKVKPMSLRITTSEKEIEGDFLVYFIFNSKGAGGFKNVAQKAAIDDGVFDFIAVKSGNLIKLTSAAARLFQGEKVESENLIYLQDNYFKIECLKEDCNTEFCDIDGEKGPSIPLEINIFPKSFKVFTG